MENHKKPIDLFAKHRIEREKLYRETPVQLEQSFKYIDIPKQPSGFTPMAEVELEGVVNRNLASGKLPWWVMGVYWFMLGCSGFMMLGILLSRGWAGNITTFITVGSFLLFALPSILIAWRGIKAKMSQTK